MARFLYTLLAVFLLSPHTPLVGASPFSFSVSAHFLPARGTLRTTSIVEPDKRNLALILWIDCDTFYTSHQVNLNEKSPKQIVFDFKDLPGGDCEAGATLAWVEEGKVKSFQLHQPVQIMDPISSF